MKNLQKILVFSFFLFCASKASSQARPDIGIKFNTAEYNRIQVEFRKPLGEKNLLRFGLSEGQWSGYQYNVLTSANDSLVTFREKTGRGQYYDFRFGFERNLWINYFSLNADLILAYSKLEYHHWDSYAFKDTFNVWNEVDYFAYPSQSMFNNSANATEHLLGAGLAAGFSFNFPLADQFFLNFNLTYNALFRYKISHHETSDVLNEFQDGSGTTLDFYTSAGIGLRYIFPKKKEKESGKG